MVAKKDDLVTKGYLNERLGKFKTELKGELKTDLLDIKDEIVGEIKAMREEFDAHQFSHVRINDEIQDHERRISKVEKASSN